MTLLPTLRKSLYLRIPWVRWNIGISLLLNAGIWVFVYFTVEPQINPVPLHVSIYFGIDYTAPYWYYYFFPLGGFIVALAHIMAARLYYRSVPFFSLILLTSSSLLQGIIAGVVVFLTRLL